MSVQVSKLGFVSAVGATALQYCRDLVPSVPPLTYDRCLRHTLVYGNRTCQKEKWGGHGEGDYLPFAYGLERFFFFPFSLKCIAY